MGFGQALGVAIIIVLFVAGFIYWVRYLLNKVAPHLKYKFKYNFLKKNFREKDVEMLVKYAKANVNPIRLQKYLLTHDFSTEKSKEMLWIYSEIKKELKGGIIKNE